MPELTETQLYNLSNGNYHGDCADKDDIQKMAKDFWKKIDRLTTKIDKLQKRIRKLERGRK
jgi:hypothetical protein